MTKAGGLGRRSIAIVDSNEGRKINDLLQGVSVRWEGVFERFHRFW